MAEDPKGLLGALSRLGGKPHDLELFDLVLAILDVVISMRQMLGQIPDLSEDAQKSFKEVTTKLNEAIARMKAYLDRV